MFGLVLLTGIGAVFAVLFTPVIEPILLGFVFAFIFHAMVRMLSHRYHRMKYGITTVFLYLGLALIFGFIVISLGMRTVESVKNVFQTINSGADSIDSGAPVDGLSQEVTQALQNIGVPDAAQAATNLIKSIGSRLTLGLSSLIGLIGTVGVALIFAFMLQMAVYSRKQGALSWLPKSYVREATVLMAKLDSTWAGYLIAGVAFASVLALLSLVQYVLMGVPYPVILATLTGFLTLIPSIGGFLASFIVFLACLMLGSTSMTGVDNLTFALMVLIVNVPITQGTYYFVGLPLTGRGVRLPIAIVFIGALAGLSTGSLLIAWLTVPIIATLRIFGSYLLAKVGGRAVYPGEQAPEGAENGFLSRLFSPSEDTEAEVIKPKELSSPEQPAEPSV